MSSRLTAECGVRSAGSHLVGMEEVIGLCMPHAEPLLLLLLLLLQKRLSCVRMASCHPLHVIKL